MATRQSAKADGSSGGTIITAWASYTPTITTSGTNPDVGDGTIAGVWRRIGDSIDITVRIAFGTSGTAFGGAGLEWLISIPAGLTTDDTLIAGVASLAGEFQALDISASPDDYHVGSMLAIADTIRGRITGSPTTPLINSTSPFSWQNSDRLVMVMHGILINEYAL